MAFSLSRALYFLVDLVLKLPGVLPLAQWLLTPKQPNLQNDLVAASERAAAAVASTESNSTSTDIERLDHCGWVYDQKSHSWRKRKNPERGDKVPVKSLSVLHYNVMMDMYSSYIPGVIYSEDRYREILKRVFEGQEGVVADVVCLNEVDHQFLGMLTKHPTVQEEYVMTDCTANNEPTFDHSTHGVLVLVSKSLCVDSIQTLRSTVRTARGKQKKSRASVIVRMELNGKPLTLVACHFEAMTSNFQPRCQQLFDIYTCVATATQNGQALILGDFNFHQEAESVAIASPYVDLWKHLHPDKPEEEGFTWDSQKNKLIKRVVLGVDTRRMRLDRAILSAQGDKRDILKPREITLFGTEAFPLPNGRLLHPSDHFGLSCKFDVQHPM